MPDRDIIAPDHIAVTTDSTILDQVGKWVSLNAYLLPQHLPLAWTIDLM